MKRPTDETRQTKHKANNVKKTQRKLTDLPAKKDPRGGEVALNYGGIKYDYHQH
jgi:hypothetical protein